MWIISLFVTQIINKVMSKFVLNSHLYSYNVNMHLFLFQHMNSRRHKDRLAGKPPKPKFSPHSKTQPTSAVSVRHTHMLISGLTHTDVPHRYGFHSDVSFSRVSGGMVMQEEPCQPWKKSLTSTVSPLSLHRWVALNFLVKHLKNIIYISHLHLIVLSGLYADQISTSLNLHFALT